MKTHHFHTKLPYQKTMLRQREWWLQNGPTTKNGVLPVTTLFFWKFCFSLRISYKELIWYTNNPNAHILTFRKRWSFIWRCFFPVSILNYFCKKPQWVWNFKRLQRRCFSVKIAKILRTTLFIVYLRCLLLKTGELWNQREHWHKMC